MKIGDNVTVFDRYRFAIPVKGKILRFSQTNDGVAVELTTTNNPHYPVGTEVWIDRQQCLGEYTPAAPQAESPALAPKLPWWKRLFSSSSTRSQDR